MPVTSAHPRRFSLMAGGAGIVPDDRNIVNATTPRRTFRCGTGCADRDERTREADYSGARWGQNKNIKFSDHSQQPHRYPLDRKQTVYDDMHAQNDAQHIGSKAADDC